MQDVKKNLKEAFDKAEKVVVDVPDEGEADKHNRKKKAKRDLKKEETPVTLPKKSTRRVSAGKAPKTPSSTTSSGKKAVTPRPPTTTTTSSSRTPTKKEYVLNLEKDNEDLKKKVEEMEKKMVEMGGKLRESEIKLGKLEGEVSGANRVVEEKEKTVQLLQQLLKK